MISVKDDMTIKEIQEFHKFFIELMKELRKKTIDQRIDFLETVCLYYILDEELRNGRDLNEIKENMLSCLEKDSFSDFVGGKVNECS